MNGAAARLPKHVADKSEGAPASANWVKRQWWKYSHSAQKASPPPRFLLVVLLSAQILFLALVRLGPSASAWGLGPVSRSEGASLSFPFLRGNAANISRVSLENEEPSDGESTANSSVSNDMRVSDDSSAASSEERSDEDLLSLNHKRVSDDSLSASSEERSDEDSPLSSTSSSSLSSSSSSLSEKSARPRQKTIRKDKARVKKLPSAKRTPKKKKSGNVASLAQHNSENSFNTASQQAEKTAEMKERYDDLLPSVDDKPLVDPTRNTQKDDSLLDTSTAMENKQDDKEEASGETASFSSMMKAQTSQREKVANAENADKVDEATAVAKAQAEMEQALSGESVKEGASLIEKLGPGELFEKGEEPASYAEKGSEAISKVDAANESPKEEAQAVPSKEADDAVSKKAQVKPSIKESVSEKESELGSVKEEPVLVKQLSDATTSSACRYGYIYVYDLPRIFNHDIIANCTALNPWLDVCPSLANGGLGDSLGEASPLGQIGSWYTTDQFMAEILFHNRILQHRCLTDKMEKASGFYVPFYAGLDVGRYLWEGSSAERRDRVSNQFLEWLSEQPAWKKSGGSDHFMMIGRITWDFRRSRDEDWGSGFFHKPAMQKVTKLLIERNPWDVKEMAVPYPSNFHPQSDADLVAWQNHIRGLQRSNLFSFAGAPRERFSDDFRSILFEQCRQAAGNCGSLDCSNRTCDDNQKTLELFMGSKFCLQPRGDSFTRRSTFDCLLAGSIPVFFWHRSAYMQYKWHLPEDEASYSVFIAKEDMRKGTRIEDVLKALSPEKVQSMQEAVIQLVPKIVYAASGFSLQGNDAFDVAVEGVMKGFKELSVSAEK